MTEHVTRVTLQVTVVTLNVTVMTLDLASCTNINSDVPMSTLTLRPATDTIACMHMATRGYLLESVAKWEINLIGSSPLSANHCHHGYTTCTSSAERRTSHTCFEGLSQQRHPSSGCFSALMRIAKVGSRHCDNLCCNSLRNELMTPLF